MKKCDAVINASLKEGAVTVSFDSMALGKPLLCIDTTGYTRYFPKSMPSSCNVVRGRLPYRNWAKAF